MTSEPTIEEIRAHERIWQGLHDKATALLDTFGEKDYCGRADYWIVDDDWGWDVLQVEIQHLKMIRPIVISKLKQVLADYPGWHIAVRVDVPGTEKQWPLMGLLVFHDRVIDHLEREYLPGEFRNLRYDSNQN